MVSLLQQITQEGNSKLEITTHKLTPRTKYKINETRMNMIDQKSVLSRIVLIHQINTVAQGGDSQSILNEQTRKNENVFIMITTTVMMMVTKHVNELTSSYDLL
jgi:hypothetical protein